MKILYFIGAYGRQYAANEIHYELGREFARAGHEMVVFAPQNLLNDPPFTKLDIISCRNLLIYFNSDLQKRLLPIFHYALKPGGLLMFSTFGPDTLKELRQAWSEVDESPHVSPFMDMDVDYDWRFVAPGKRLIVHMENRKQNGRYFDATLTLSRREPSTVEEV